MPAPAAVVFDCDGLLLATEDLWTRAEEKLWAEHGRTFDVEQKRQLIGSSSEVAGRIMERLLDRPGEGPQLAERLAAMALDEAATGPVVAMPGALELLADLAQAGVPVALASNSTRAFVDRCLAGAGLQGAFVATVSSSDVANPKPAADAYLQACRLLGVDPAASVALEDSPTGVAAAVAAGCTVVGVPSVPGVQLPGAHLVVPSLAAPELRALVLPA